MNPIYKSVYMPLTLVLLVAGCASSVHRADPTTRDLRLTGDRVAGVEVTLSAAARQKQADNPQFSAATLSERIRAELARRRALDPAAQQAVVVTVTDFRVRSTGAAIWFGILAGTDSLEGDVALRGPSGLTRSVKISASYGLGGFGGGQDSGRMGWLYEKFSELLANELLGEAP